MIDFFEASGMTPEELDEIIDEAYLASKDSFAENLNNNPRYRELQDKIADSKQKLMESLDGEKKIIMEEYFEKMDTHFDEKRFDSYKRGFKMAILLSCLSPREEQDDG